MKYTVSPPGALRTWTTNQDDDYITFRDLGFDVKENITWSVSASSLDKKISSSKNTKLTNGIANQIVIQHTEDTVVQEYLIKTWYVPMAIQKNYDPTTSQTTSVKIDNQLDPKTDFSWVVDDVGFLDASADWHLSPEDFWKKEITSKANTRMSISEYRATPWYWRPAHDAIFNWNGTVAAGPWTAEQTGNQPATLVDVIDKTVVSSETTDILTVTFAHNGVTCFLSIGIPNFFQQNSNKFANGIPWNFHLQIV